MGITISQYRMAIGLFNCNFITCECSLSSTSITFLIVLWYLTLLMVHFIISSAVNAWMEKDEIVTHTYKPGVIISCSYIYFCKVLLFSVLSNNGIFDKRSDIINRTSTTYFLHHCILALLLWNYVNMYYFV